MLAEEASIGERVDWKARRGLGMRKPDVLSAVCISICCLVKL